MVVSTRDIERAASYEDVNPLVESRALTVVIIMVSKARKSVVAKSVVRVVMK